ncbi:glutamine synthetase [Saprospira grandis DSM 2844]|uniref:Glutamine synthetase n=1 Tax=Saprospira grandis DSM 2844 TaxID=694433 RepID=J0P3I2_9BACT|nr:glutamine synthetase [Saprospira grandis DSM 2844]
MRFSALESLLARENTPVQTPSSRISDYFASQVFGKKAMQEFLPARIYKQVIQTIESGENLDRETADHIADAMRNWASSKGVTHYAHWFQPLTGRTAEKHDSFFTLDGQGAAIEEFRGEALVQQEPDGSSFPGGGLRSTFEARGYTAWDPSSPAFILEVGDDKTLCIPTIFVTYGGQSLDYKLPLLKSQSCLEKAAVKVCQLFDPAVQKVYATLGWEQEYFLIDEALYEARPDLRFTGRTLLGRSAPKGQQLDDHYFGSIPERAYAYMRDLEVECHKLGIPVRTRHNEVAPSQYELAPQYEEINVAVDHNQLLMDLMDRIARRHKLRVLLHEKPYANVNGSGKHNNWSIATDTGKNLLSPGKNPGKNLQFLAFFVNTIRAVYEHADLLRASIASASNDHRLGANEAPPAIISVFIGEALTKVLDAIEEGDSTEAEVSRVFSLLSKIPDLEKDNTDRNRTSPFAFTGNKFEIRMVGSTANCAGPMTIMNSIMGQQLENFYADVASLKAAGQSQQSAILQVIKRYIIESKPIRFEGDNYSDEWKEEAKSRGLNNFMTTPEALTAYATDKAKALFTSTKVLSEEELAAHLEVRLESYALQLQIESRILAEMVVNQVIPAAVRYQNSLAQNALQLKQLGLEESSYAAQKELLAELSEGISALKTKAYAMKQLRVQAGQLEAEEMAHTYCNEVKPLMDEIRVVSDQLEGLVDDQEWPFLKYREMMFMS